MTDDFLAQLQRATFGDQLPPGEKERLSSSLPAASHPPADPDEPESRERLFDAAAVTGYFEPARLARRIVGGMPSTALSELAAACDVTTEAGVSPRWILRSNPRRERLAQLSEDGRRLTAALAPIRGQVRDGVGRFLGLLLENRQIPPEPGTVKQLRDLLQAMDWVKEILPFKEEAAELRRRLASRSMQESLSKLLRDGFFGRAKESRLLVKFLAANRGKRPSQDVRIPVLTISGIGGSGKSTFVARTVSQLLADTAGPIAIAIDFDRFGFGPDSLLELTFELTRQLSLHEPSLLESCQQLRREMRAQALDAHGDDGKFDLEGSVSTGEGLWRRCVERLGKLVAGQGPAERPIALFLDTFEQAQAVRVWGSPWSSGRDASSRIGTWLEMLVESGGLIGLSVVVSGRAAVEPDSQLGRHVVKKIVLGDLDLAARIRLLHRLKVPASLAEELAGALGGNPLMLRIGARLLARLEPETRERVLADLRTSGNFADEFIQGFLYERVLRHVADLKVRRLAHPGLALRLVTWRLIKEVLAQPCGLGSITDQEARDLLAALGDEVWLVDRRPGASFDMVLEHRRDIRALMLRMMPFDLEKKAAGGSAAAPGIDKTLQEIHRLAAAYHDRRQDPDLDPQTAAREAAYHRLISWEGELRPDDIELAGRDLGNDLAALPIAKRTRVKVELGDALTPAEIAAASADDWLIYSLREGSARLFDQEDPVAALELVEQRRPRHPGELPAWYLKALDAAVRWKDADRGELEDLQEWLGRQEGGIGESAGLEAIAISGTIDTGTHRMLAEDLADRSAALFQLRFKREEYREAYHAARAFLQNQKLSSRLFHRDSTQWANLVHAVNDARVGEVAAASRGQYIDSFFWRGEDELLERTHSTRRHDSNLNAELQRYVALNWRKEEDRIPRLWATPRTFVPDPNWLEQIVHLASSGPAGERLVLDLDLFLGETQQKIDRGMTTNELSSAVAVEFAKIYDRYRAPFLVAEQLHGLDPWLLRGDDREFRPAAKFALRAAFPGPQDIRLLAELAQEIFRWKPRDLSPTQLEKEAGKIAVSRLVDFADAAQVLDSLLMAAHHERPLAEPLALAADALSRWDDALAGAIKG